MSGIKKVKVYSATYEGSEHFFSEGVTREFGENKMMFIHGGTTISLVQPLHTTEGLNLIGYIYVH
jgi:hypothetical protein